YFVPADELVRRHAMYRDEARAAGRSEAEIERLMQQSWGMRVVHVSPTHDEALRSEGLGGALPDSFDRSLVRLRPFRDYLDDGLAMIGSPDEVRDRLQEYLETTGYLHVLLLIALPGLGTADALRSMRLFAEEVRPGMKSLAQRA